MAEPQTTSQTPKSSTASSAQAMDAVRRGAETAEQQSERTEQAAKAVAEKTADASRDAARANREIIQRNVETAHDAVRSGLETGAQTFQSLTQSLSRSFGAMTPNPDLADQSARNIRAVSEASTALARGTQEAARAWFDLVQNSVRANLEAFGEFTGCRSIQDLTALQTRLARENLQRMIESGQQISQVSTQAISEANRAMQQGGARMNAPA